ncbi:MAG TPA: hypothetical protein VJX67_07300 [Blastocatellia bacterium]|nr:hypothetical protein [Blastocatellia bacterium]
MPSKFNPSEPPPLPTPDGTTHACKIYQYAVKMLCGSYEQPLGEQIFANDQYFTVINIHNPAVCKTVTFRWRPVFAGRPSAPIAPISPQTDVILRPGQAVEIDCSDIVPPSPTPFDGFVMIESPCELDVVAVYTVGTLPNPAVPSTLVAFATERVPARYVDACNEDLTLDLSTGVAEWTLVDAPPGTPGPIPRPADVILAADKNSAWSLAQPGTQWIGAYPSSADGLISPPEGFYTFQTCFSLCSDFSDAQITLTMLNDNRVTDVWVNDRLSPITNPSNFGGPPATFPPVTTGFLPGLNCLSIVVENAPGGPTGNPVGLDVLAQITAVRGNCHDCGCGCTDTKLIRTSPAPQPPPPASKGKKRS